MKSPGVSAVQIVQTEIPWLSSKGFHIKSVATRLIKVANEALWPDSASNLTTDDLDGDRDQVKFWKKKKRQRKVVAAKEAEGARQKDGET